MKQGGKEGRKEKRKGGREREMTGAVGWPGLGTVTPVLPRVTHPFPPPICTKARGILAILLRLCRIGEEQGCFHDLCLALCWLGWQWGLVPGVYLFW